MRHRALIQTLAYAAMAVCATVALADDTAKLLPPADQKPVQDRSDVKTESATSTTLPRSDAGKPTTEPATKADVSPEAQKIVNDVSAAYAKLKSLELVGEFSGHFDAAGQQSGGMIAFTSSFQSPNKFRHTSKDDVLIGSNGEKAYAYGSEDNVFAQADSPKDKVATKDLPIGFRDLLSAQNPSLRLALAKDPGVEMIEDVKEVSRIDDIKVGEVACLALKLTLNDKTLLTLAIDPTTHLIRRAQLDLRAKLESEKIPDIKEAFYTVNYTTITPDAAVKDEQFAWTPPAGAKDIKGLSER